MRMDKYFLIFIISVFIILQVSLYTPLLSDENNYFYLGKLVSEGYTPYRDFFFAHPPLQLYIFAFLFRVFGYSFYVIKSIALVSTIMTSILIYKLSKENYKWLGTLIFLFTSNVFFSGAVNMGINLTTVFLIGGYYLLKRRKYIFSGLLFGLAGMSGTYSLPIILIILAIHYKNIFEIGLGFFLTFVLPHLLLLMIVPEFINNVYLYHLSKPFSSGISKYNFFSNLLSSDLIIWLPLITFSVINIFRKDKAKGLLFIIGGFLAFIFLLNRPLSYYMILIYPFMALLINYTIVNIRVKLIRICTVGCIILLAILTMTSLYKNTDSFLKENAFTKLDEVSLFFDDKPGTLFGDFSIVPLLALETDREMIVGNKIDTFPLAIEIIGINNMAAQLKEKKPDYFIKHLIGSTSNPIWRVAKLANFFNKYCADQIKDFEDNRNSYEIYRCEYDY